MNPLDRQFYIQQLRCQGGQAKAVKAQKAVAPVFSATGDHSYYDLPAYLRKRLSERDQDNQRRLVEYVKRAQKAMEDAA